MVDVNPPDPSSNLLLSVWSSHRRVLRWVVAERGAVCRAGGGGSNASCCCRGQRSHIRSFLFFFINAQPSFPSPKLSRPGEPTTTALVAGVVKQQQPTVVGSSFPSQRSAQKKRDLLRILCTVDENKLLAQLGFLWFFSWNCYSAESRSQPFQLIFFARF